MTDRIKSLLKSKHIFSVLIILSAVGLLLILFSGDTSSDDMTEKSDKESTYEYDEYEENLEKRLTEILSRIDGVGEVSVMVTLESTEEYIYAEKTDKDESKLKTELVITNEGGIITRVNSPKITGAVIVCEGGDNLRVCEKIYEAVSVALGITSNRISIGKME